MFCHLKKEMQNQFLQHCGVKRKRKNGLVSKISALKKKGVGSGICVNATKHLYWLPENCIYQFLLSENVVMCYILLNVMFK